MSCGRYVVVVGHGSELGRADGAAAMLRALGAAVRTLELFAEPEHVLADDPSGRGARGIIVEAPERPDLAAAALRELRRATPLAGCAALAALSAAQVAQLDPASGFDDFVLTPYVPAELYARLRAAEWRRSEFANEERIKLGGLVIDRAGREVTLDGAVIPFTAREFGLLVYLCERRGRVVSREEALARVWPANYEGGLRTVDIHVRRLRHKLGETLPLETLRGAGYKLALPRGPRPDESAAAEDEELEAPGSPRATASPRLPRSASFSRADRSSPRVAADERE